MPWLAFGRPVSAISAPSPSQSDTVRSNTSRTPGSIPSASLVSSRGTPIRSPFRSSREGIAIGSGKPIEVESRSSRPPSAASSSAASRDVAGERAALVERGGEGDHPRARDRAVGGLHPDDAAERGGLADRSAGVGAERAGREPARDDGGRPAGGAAGDARTVPGIADVAVGRVLVRRAHRELVHVGLAEDAGTGGEEPLDGGRGVGRHIALEDPRAGGRGQALDAEDVLDRDRHAGKITAFGLLRRRARRRAARGRRRARRASPRRRRTTRRRRGCPPRSRRGPRRP